MRGAAGASVMFTGWWVAHVEHDDRIAGDANFVPARSLERWLAYATFCVRRDMLRCLRERMFAVRHASSQLVRRPGRRMSRRRYPSGANPRVTPGGMYEMNSPVGRMQYCE